MRPKSELVEPGAIVQYDAELAYMWISVCKACGHEQDTFSRNPYPRALPCTICGGKNFFFLSPKTPQLGLIDGA